MKKQTNKGEPTKKKGPPFVLKTRDKVINLAQFDPNIPTMLRESIDCDRLFINNANGHTINVTPGASISADYTLIAGNRLTIVGSDPPGEPHKKTNWKGGFRIAGSIEQLSINNLDINTAEHGILASQHTEEEHYGFIELNNCHIHHIEKEGIYLGKSDASATAPRNGYAHVKNCFIYLCGWDGIQIGRFTNTQIKDTEVTNCGTANVPWQDKAITINPHCQRVDIINCTFRGPQQYLQSGKIFVN